MKRYTSDEAWPFPWSDLDIVREQWDSRVELFFCDNDGDFKNKIWK